MGGLDGVHILSYSERDVLFEAIWPASGVNYNAYLVETDDGYVLVDGAPEYLANRLISDVERVAGDDLTHVVVNHMEPDHSGSLPRVLERYPHAEVLISTTGARLFSVPRSRPVPPGEELRVGGRTFRFHPAPWVHWPETMFTELDGEVLFTCDVLGSFGAFDPLDPPENYEEELLRYTASVLGGYRTHLLRALDLIDRISPSVVAPGHGAVLRGEDVRRYVSVLRRFLTEQGGTVVLYASMYGYTERLALSFARGRGIPAMDVLRSSILDILVAATRAKTIYFFVPTYEASIFPPAAQVLDILVSKHALEGKTVRVVNTYSWAPAATKIEERYGFPVKAVKAGTDPSAVDI